MADHIQQQTIPDWVRDKVYSLASTGWSKRGIARSFDVSLETFNRWMEDYPALGEAFEHGRDGERQTLHNVLYKLAVDKEDKISAMFLLKARHGYREGDQSEQANRVAVVFNLPGAMTPEQYRVVDSVAKKPPKPDELDGAKTDARD